MMQTLIDRGFDIRYLHHAEAILAHDLREAVREIEEVLLRVELPIEEILRGGGGETRVVQRIRRDFAERQGWQKHKFEIVKTVDGEPATSSTHEIDHVRHFEGGCIALEIEWNNKDPFFDRDLENFKRLHAEAAISLGVIITRGKSLHDAMEGIVKAFGRKNGITGIDSLRRFYQPTARQRAAIEKATAKSSDFVAGWAPCFVSDKFGESTTHWRKLMDRVDRGVGSPCPLLLIGLPSSIVKGV
jgi:hypothetical protein